MAVEDEAPPPQRWSLVTLPRLVLLGAFIVGAAAVSGNALEWIRWSTEPVGPSDHATNGSPGPAASQNAASINQALSPAPAAPPQTGQAAPAGGRVPPAPPVKAASGGAAVSQQATVNSINVNDSPGAITGANININTVTMDPQP